MKRIFALVLALTICLFSAAALAEGKPDRDRKESD